MIVWREFDTTEQLVQALGTEIVTSVDRAVQTTEQCSIALAGGNTPKPLYEWLNTQDLPWDQLKLTLTDERWVGVLDDDSNQKLVEGTLLLSHAEAEYDLESIGGSHSAQLVALKNSAQSASEGQPITEELLDHYLPMLDVTVLGMGVDGHIASIFPNMENTKKLLSLNNPNRCEATAPEGKHERITLTLRYLLSAPSIYLIISGQDKKEIIDRVKNNRDPALAMTYPVHALLHQNHRDVNIFWTP